MGTASYLELGNMELRHRSDLLQEHLYSCSLCPRRCCCNRSYGVTGACNAGKMARIAGHMPLFGEEPVLCGSGGSGVILFSHCELRCSFCNSFVCSLEGVGQDITNQQLSGIMIELQEKGCHNIQLVTPVMFLPHIVEAIFLARANGLTVPIVYNSSGYDRPEILQNLNGIVDIFMPDLKFATGGDSKHFTDVDNYHHISINAVMQMFRQVGNLLLNDEGVAESGLIIRHLLMPDRLDKAEQIMRAVSEYISPDVYFSLMGRFIPTENVQNDSGINRIITEDEFEKGLRLRHRYGLKYGWNQKP